jgi:hypothetical protein
MQQINQKILTPTNPKKALSLLMDGRPPLKKQPAPTAKEPSTNNSFDALQHIPENLDELPTPPSAQPIVSPSLDLALNSPMIEKTNPYPPINNIDSEAHFPEEGEAEMELEDQDLAGVDLVHLDQAYQKKGLYIIPHDQLHKIHKVFLNSSAGSSAQSNSGLGIHRNQQKDQHKPQKDERKRGRKSTSTTYLGDHQSFHGKLWTDPTNL